MAKDAFKCLRCGNTYEQEPDPKQDMKDRVCPRCKSNSVRRLKPRE